MLKSYGNDRSYMEDKVTYNCNDILGQGIRPGYYSSPSITCIYCLTVLNLGRFAPLTVEYPASASEIINI